MINTKKALFTACLLVISAGVLQACEKTWGCTLNYRPGPAIVTIDCVDTARAGDLDEEELIVEFKDGDDWLPCNWYPHYLPHTQPVCDSTSLTSPQFTCGNETGTFEIRARQNGRLAGPVEIKTRMKDHCDYDPNTLYHELHLDLVD